MKSKLVLSIVLLSCSGLHAALSKLAAVSSIRRLFSTTLVAKECCGHGCINCPEQFDAQNDPFTTQLEALLIEAGFQVLRMPGGGLFIEGNSLEKLNFILKEAQDKTEKLWNARKRRLLPETIQNEVGGTWRCGKSGTKKHFLVDVKHPIIGGGFGDFYIY